jgi:FixJ family two-component response regulator
MAGGFRQSLQDRGTGSLETKTRNDPAPVLMTSGHGDIATTVAAIKNGAFDFIQKPFKGKDLLDRLEKVVAGFSDRTGEVLEERTLSLNFPDQEPLTGREREVLQLVAAGSSNKDIGAALGISYRTVEDHHSKIMRKLGVRNVAELLSAVFR